jgi:hypothetical protein
LDGALVDGMMVVEGYGLGLTKRREEEEGLFCFA